MDLISRFTRLRSQTNNPRETALSLDDILYLIKDERRREIIQRASDHDEPLELGELATAMAYIEGDYDTLEDVPSDHRKRLWVSIHQTHLPVLEDHDAIEDVTGMDVPLSKPAQLLLDDLGILTELQDGREKISRDDAREIVRRAVHAA